VTLSDGQRALTATAVLCSRDGGELLSPALAALRATLGPGDDAIVVDSASVTASVAQAAAAHELRCVRLDLPGTSRARNAGLREADTEIIAYTDDDCSPSADWLTNIRRHFADPRVAFVTGRVGASGKDGITASTLERTEAVRYDGPQDPYGMGHGANMAFRRSVLLELGGFDEALGPGTSMRAAEDADILYRCLAAGWAGVYDPDSYVTHEQWRTDGEIVRLRYAYGLGNGAFRVKAARQNPRVGLRLLLRSLWGQGLAPMLRAVRRLRLGALPAATTWTAGMLVGMARGLRMSLDGPNFAGRDRSG
jgi:GT2 family glycosyltransferase